MATLSLIVLAVVIVMLLWHGWFLWRAEWRVGQVVDEYCYRSLGSPMRFYRVEYALRNGQRVQVRSMAAHPALQPALGKSVSVLVLEREGHAPRVRIATVWELCFTSFIVLLLSLPGLFVLWVHHVL